jgi:hypothetical protein
MLERRMGGADEPRECAPAQGSIHVLICPTGNFSITLSSPF